MVTDVELRHLRYFVAVAEQLSFRRRRRVENHREERDSSGSRRLVFRRLFNGGQRSFDRLRLCLSGQKIHEHYRRIQITNHGEQLVVLTMALDPFPAT
jgi:hypothetical protein